RLCFMDCFMPRQPTCLGWKCRRNEQQGNLFPNATRVDSVFADRNDDGVTIGNARDVFHHKSSTFVLKGSTLSPSVLIGTTTYTSFAVKSINRWGTIVGWYADAAGAVHGFKRWSRERRKPFR